MVLKQKISRCFFLILLSDYSSSAMYNITTGLFLCDMTTSLPGVLGLSVPWRCPTTAQITAKSWCDPWSGLLCSATKNIISIDLSSKQLEGFLPNSLGKVSTLKYLYLQQNLISSTIPPSVGNLSSLLGLRLENNLLEGTVPMSLTKLRRLTVLNLNANYLMGSIPNGFAAQTYNDDNYDMASSFDELSHYPTSQPTGQPSRQPTSQPTSQPTRKPSTSEPSASPTGRTAMPSISQDITAPGPSSMPSSATNVTDFSTNSRKFYSEPGPMAGFIIGSVVVLGLLILSAYYCMLSSLGYKGVGLNSVTPTGMTVADGATDKNILV